MDNYITLKSKVNKKNIENSFNEVNKEIDNIISKYTNPKTVIETLICHLEAKYNNSTEYSIYAIIYALIIGVVSVLSNVEMGNQQSNLLLALSIILMVPTIAFLIFLIIDKKVIYKDMFVLKCLQYKYEELCKLENNKTIDNAQQDDTQEYIVRVKKQ